MGRAGEMMCALNSDEEEKGFGEDSQNKDGQPAAA